jgi:hypothetical protein
MSINVSLPERAAISFLSCPRLGRIIGAPSRRWENGNLAGTLDGNSRPGSVIAPPFDIINIEKRLLGPKNLDLQSQTWPVCTGNAGRRREGQC